MQAHGPPSRGPFCMKTFKPLPPDCTASERMTIEAAFHDQDYRTRLLVHLAETSPELFFEKAQDGGEN